MDSFVWQNMEQHGFTMKRHTPLEEGMHVYDHFSDLIMLLECLRVPMLLLKMRFLMIPVFHESLKT